ncbi:MAG: PspA/IM30 family protein [Cyanobacteriota bacterium]
MGIIERIISVIKSNLNHLISRAEDPEKMLNQMMIDMKEQLMNAKKQVATSIADEKRLKSQLEKEIEQSQHWEKRAMQAVEAGNDELAREALARKAEHDNNTQQFRDQWEGQKQSVDKLKDSLRLLNKKIEEAKRKKNLLVAKAKRAEAQKKIHDTMSGLNDSAAFDTFDRMTEKVDQMIAEAGAAAEMNEEFTGDQLEKKFDQLGNADGILIDDALSQLKAKMGKTTTTEVETQTQNQTSEGTI